MTNSTVPLSQVAILLTRAGPPIAHVVSRSRELGLMRKIHAKFGRLHVSRDQAQFSWIPRAPRQAAIPQRVRGETITGLVELATPEGCALSKTANILDLDLDLDLDLAKWLGHKTTAREEGGGGIRHGADPAVESQKPVEVIATVVLGREPTRRNTTSLKMDNIQHPADA